MISGTLVASLLVAIAGYTGYGIPGMPPRITALPQNELAQRICGRPCGIVGFTLPDGEILLDQSLAIGLDPVATSILVHEMTHFLQIRNDTTGRPPDCQTWREREREAYDVQLRWLRETAPSIGVFAVEMRQLPRKVIILPCGK